MDLDFNFDSEEILDEVSEFNYKNGAPYLKVKRNLTEDQAFFVTHLEIREKSGVFGAGGNEIYTLLDSERRNDKGYLPSSKVEKRVANTNKNHGKEWFIVEVGIVLDLID